MKHRLLLFLFIVFGQEGIGSEGMDSGGGLGIVCFEDIEIAKEVRSLEGIILDTHIEGISSIESVDYHFAKMPRGPIPTPISLESTENFENSWEFYNFIVNRIAGELPRVYDFIKKSEGEFIDSEITWAQLAMMTINDVNMGAVISDPKCVLTTIALQYKEEDRNYLQIDPRLFFHPKHSLISQTSLYLHEFIYLHARKREAADSRSTRLLVGYLLREWSDELAEYIRQRVPLLGF